MYIRSQYVVLNRTAFYMKMLIIKRCEIIVLDLQRNQYSLKIFFTAITMYPHNQSKKGLHFPGTWNLVSTRCWYHDPCDSDVRAASITPLAHHLTIVTSPDLSTRRQSTASVSWWTVSASLDQFCLWRPAAASSPVQFATLTAAANRWRAVAQAVGGWARGGTSDDHVLAVAGSPLHLHALCGCSAIRSVCFRIVAAAPHRFHSDSGVPKLTIVLTRWSSGLWLLVTLVGNDVAKWEENLRQNVHFF